MTQQIEKGITIKEFKMWLEGVEEMQPEGWTPDARQWKRIREKLETIEEAVPVAQVQPPAVLYRNFEQEVHSEPRYNGPVQLAAPGLSSGISAPPSNNVLFGNADNPTNPVRTPNLDTSTGTYEPAFI